MIKKIMINSLKIVLLNLALCLPNIKLYFTKFLKFSYKISLKYQFLFFYKRKFNQ